jgi:small conductance mechanosensitive channel
MRRTLRVLLLLLPAIVFAGPIATTARAQDEPAADAPDPSVAEKAELADEGTRLLKTLRLVHERVVSLETRLGNAEGEDRQIIGRQTADSKLEYIEVLHKLVVNLMAQEGLGAEAPDVRAKVESDLNRLPGAVESHIDDAVEDLHRLRERRDALPLEEQPAVEHRIARHSVWVTDLLTAYAELTSESEAVGLDARERKADALRRTAEMAEIVAGRLGLVAERREVLAGQLADNPDDAELGQELKVIDRRLASLVDSLSTMADLIDGLGGDSDAHRQLLIESTGTLTIDVFRGKVLTGLLDEWWDEARGWARVNAPVMAFRVIVFILILCVFRLLAAVIRRLLLRRFDRADGDKSSLMRQMTEALTVRTVMLIGFLIGVSQLGVELGPLLAGLGIAGFIVGFALQDSLSNFAAGVMILIYRPFDVGDTIEAAGVMGNVDRMSLVSTTILTIDNQTLIVPNSKIWGNVIRNVTRQSLRRIDLKFKIAYTEELPRVEKIFREIVTAHPQTLDTPEARVSLHEMGEYAMEIIVRPWVNTVDYWPVYWELMRTIKLRLDAEGIAIPLPGREVHLRKEAE